MDRVLVHAEVNAGFIPMMSSAMIADVIEAVVAVPMEVAQAQGIQTTVSIVVSIIVMPILTSFIATSMELFMSSSARACVC